MKVSEFISKYYQFAKVSEQKTGIDARVTLAQAALESGWGEHAPGNMFFGVKDTDGINGNEQLLQTVEYSKNETIKVPQIISKTFDPLKKLWRFVVKDYFRKYASPEESFTAHANFFIVNKRYASALLVKNDPYKFAEEIAKAGYATDPDYANKLKALIKTIDSYLK